MKRWHAVVVALALLVGLLLFVWPRPAERPEAVDVYPWQVQALPDGTSRVLGLQLGEATLAEASARLRGRFALAVFEEPGQPLTLEAHWGEVSLGGLSAQIVLSLAAEQQTLAELASGARERERSESGAIKHLLAPERAAALGESRIVGLTYIPYAKLKPAFVEQRFGQPAERLTDGQGLHYLYPERGVDVLLSREGRDVLQFVPPRDFARLRAPLGSGASSP